MIQCEVYFNEPLILCHQNSFPQLVVTFLDVNLMCTEKPFNLAALKVDDFACKIILAPFILANSSRTIPTHE